MIAFLFIQRAFYTMAAPIEYMKINRGRSQAFMAQQILHGSNIISILKQVRCKGMT